MSYNNPSQWLNTICAANGDRTAICFKDQKVSYFELGQHTNRIANILKELGLKKGEKIGLLLPNCPEFVYFLYGAVKVGVISACMATTFRGESLEYLINSADSKVMVVSTELEDAFLKIRDQLPGVEKIVWYPEFPKGREQHQVNEFSFNQLFSHAKASLDITVQVSDADPMLFLHSSGTTGRPKWIIQTFAFLLEQGRFFADFSGIVPSDRVYDPLPMFHGNSQMFMISGSLYANATMVIGTRFSASKLWEEVRYHKATVLVLHFTPIEFMKKQPVQAGETDHLIRVCFPADREFMERFRIPMGISGYGSIDAGIVCYEKFRLPFTESYLPNDDKRLYSVGGYPNRNVEIAVVDKEGRALPPGKVGEIVVRGLKPHVISEGYYNRSEKTLDAFRNFWFHTNDMGFIDREGRLHYSHRSAEGINIKGEWVDVPGLENVIRAHPKALDCVVVRIKDEMVGSEVKAWIELREGEVLKEEEIVAWCEGKIAHYMIPRYVEFIPELPRLAGTEKVARFALEAQGVGNSWDREKAGYKLVRS
ncbi:AMP-binding protein [Peribacillus aracenensis]|uniref:AMP-binding protein n=1 Tax=Peribacillus aracenensis TaxID=2976708 RepID=UPI0021A69C05|nr:AMP-binding protein [Peribacillus sp. BBB004]